MGASRKCLYAFAGYVGVKSLSPKFRIQRLHRILEPLFAEAPERIYVE